MTASTDHSLLLAHITQTLRPPAEWVEPVGYPDSLALCIVDSIWSIGVRYGGVVNVIAAYGALRGDAGADPDRDSAQDLRDTIATAGGPEGFANAVNNRQLTSSRNGVLKTVAVDQAAAALIATGVCTTDDLRAADPAVRDAAKKAWLTVRGQRSGISWRYLLLLTGDQQVKPDRMIVGFVTAALDRTPGTAEAAELVTAAAGQLSVPVRALDHRIWRHQSGRG